MNRTKLLKNEVRNDEKSESTIEKEIDFGPFPWKLKLVLVPKKISVRNSKCNSSKPGKNAPQEYELGVRLTCSSRDAEKYAKNVQSQIAKFPNHMESVSVKSVILPDITGESEPDEMCKDTKSTDELDTLRAYIEETYYHGKKIK